MEQINAAVEWLLKSAPEILVPVFCIAVGYFVKLTPWIGNRWIPAVCVLVAPVFYVPLAVEWGKPDVLDQVMRSVMIGFVLGVVAWMLHKGIISKIEHKFPVLGGLLEGDKNDGNDKPGGGGVAGLLLLLLALTPAMAQGPYDDLTADLSLMDASRPLDSEQARVLGAVSRQGRAKLKAWSAVEHDLQGRHTGISGYMPRWIFDTNSTAAIGQPLSFISQIAISTNTMPASTNGYQVFTVTVGQRFTNSDFVVQATVYGASASTNTFALASLCYGTNALASRVGWARMNNNYYTLPFIVRMPRSLLTGTSHVFKLRMGAEITNATLTVNGSGSAAMFSGGAASSFGVFEIQP